MTPGQRIVVYGMIGNDSEAYGERENPWGPEHASEVPDVSNASCRYGNSPTVIESFTAITSSYTSSDGLGEYSIACAADYVHSLLGIGVDR